MKKLNRKVVAATAAIALSLGIFAAVPLSAEAKTNYKITKSSDSVGSVYTLDSKVFAEVNGI